MAMTVGGATVLVTGGGGFIGSHLVEQLVDAGASVRCLLRYNSRADIGNLCHVSSSVLDAIDVQFGDLRDAETVREAMAGVDYVLHLGALIAIPYSYRRPREVIETNVMGTLNVLEAARCFRVLRVVHVSTSEVYGTAQFVPITEKHPMSGQSPYSASKIGADRIAEAYFRSFDLPVVTIRPFNTYGPRQSARAVIPTIITQVLSGNRVRLGAATPTRDFTFVSDTVAGMVLAATRPQVEGMEVNLGTGHEIAIGELALKILEIAGVELPIDVETERLRPEKSEVNQLIASNDLAAARLGWKPEVRLDEGLARTIQWVSDNLDRYRPGIYEV